MNITRLSFILLLFVVIRCNLSLLPCNYEPNGSENRRMLAITCDTRSGWKEFHAMKVWNVTGKHLRENGILMKNVCRGENWGKLGFLTKPLLYKKFLQQFLLSYSDQKNLLHVILMDSDTFWAAQNENHIWRNYDCARGGRHLVVSTEMSCWVGRYCNQDDLNRWYNDSSKFPSYSPFVNSGVVIGRVDVVIEMLDYVITHNQSYYTTYGRKHKFDDQYAIADYSLRVSPERVAIDYHQLISASCSIHAPGMPPDEGWPFLCKNRNGSLSFSCHIYNNLLRRLGHFVLDKSNCLVQRTVNDRMTLSVELSTLATEPIIWHGNGKGKRLPIRIL